MTIKDLYIQRLAAARESNEGFLGELRGYQKLIDAGLGETMVPLPSAATTQPASPVHTVTVPAAGPAPVPAPAASSADDPNA